jgi:hypothetical protein
MANEVALGEHESVRVCVAPGQADDNQLHVHSTGSGPEGCVQCEVYSNLLATGERQPR